MSYFDDELERGQGAGANIPPRRPTAGQSQTGTGSGAGRRAANPSGGTGRPGGMPPRRPAEGQIPSRTPGQNGTGGQRQISGNRPQAPGAGRRQMPPGGRPMVSGGQAQGTGRRPMAPGSQISGAGRGQTPAGGQAREPDWNRGEAMKPVPEVRELLTIPAMALLPEGIQCPETIRHQGQGWIREPALPRQGREVPEVRRALRLCLRKIMRTLARECNPEFLQKFCCRKIKRML